MLEDRKAKCATRDTDHVVVNGDDNALEGRAGVGNGYLAGAGADRNSIHIKGNVSKFAVIGRAHGVDVVHVDGVRVHVITGLSGNRGSLVPGLNEGVVIGGQASKTLSVFVKKGGIGHGVNVILARNPTVHLAIANRVIRPVT